MGNSDEADCADGLTTHTICGECSDNLDFQLGVSLQRYLESLKIPVALVDGAGKIISTNTSAGKIVASAETEAECGWHGKIYECAHARLPERCSNDIHCSGCTIRHSVMETFSSGRNIYSVPALENGCGSLPRQQCDYLISTSLIDGIVRLQIERI